MSRREAEMSCVLNQPTVLIGFGFCPGFALSTDIFLSLLMALLGPSTQTQGNHHLSCLRSALPFEHLQSEDLGFLSTPTMWSLQCTGKM